MYQVKSHLVHPIVFSARIARASLVFFRRVLRITVGLNCIKKFTLCVRLFYVVIRLFFFHGKTWHFSALLPSRGTYYCITWVYYWKE
jgi:hypothetical protein